MMQKREEIITLPGILATIAAGFDLTTKHLWLLVLPILLDIFYWLGPRLSYGALIEQGLALLPDDPMLTEFASQMSELGTYTNLFTSLSVQFIGVPALMVNMLPQTTPLPVSAVALESPAAFMGTFVLLTLVGLLLSAVYFITICVAIERREGAASLSLAAWGERIGRTWLRLLALTILFVIVSLMILLPISFFAGIMALISVAFSMLIIVVGFVLMYWIILFISLTPQGIALNGRPVLNALRESATIVRTYSVQTLGMIILTLLINTMLSSLLVMAESGTWLTVLNIGIHAFVSTALIAALFIFYRDRYRALYEPTPIES